MSIQKTINSRYTSSYWIKAEMSKINYYKHSGHCYPDLVEKKDEKVIAQMRSYIWKDDLAKIESKFLEVLKEPLKEGIKILFLAKINFDPVYGLSLWIIDIDPSYTLGDLEREKQETIKRLKTENLFEKNKTVPLPLLPKRIAIISVETSKGYADFLKIINENPWNYKFFCFLFPSLLQGEKASGEILRQLNRIRSVRKHFDLVAIVRGGGGDVGLSCYNNFELAKAICEFPLPVVTGIGHATNLTVTEMVAGFNAITPTKLAEFLIQRFHNFSVPVENAVRIITEESRQLISLEKEKLSSTFRIFRSVTENMMLNNRSLLKNNLQILNQSTKFKISKEKSAIQNYNTQLLSNTINYSEKAQSKLKSAISSFIKDYHFIIRSEKQGIAQLMAGVSRSSLQFCNVTRSKLSYLENNITNMSPEKVLSRGYSITLLDGKTVKDSTSLITGCVLTTKLNKGSIKSSVISINKATT